VSEQSQLEQDKLTREITRHQVADCSYLEEGARPTELAYGAQRVFARQQSNKQKKLLKFALSNSAWKDGS
jgi:site-specific DNA recombinase